MVPSRIRYGGAAELAIGSNTIRGFDITTISLRAFHVSEGWRTPLSTGMYQAKRRLAGNLPNRYDVQERDSET
jgi:hypothetical protein